MRRRLYGGHGTDHSISPRVARNDNNGQLEGVMIDAGPSLACLIIICPKATHGDDTCTTRTAWYHPWLELQVKLRVIWTHLVDMHCACRAETCL